MPTSEYYIGLMSGTSADGIDAALVEFGQTPRLLGFLYQAYPASFKHALQDISPSHAIKLVKYGALDCQLGHLFAACVIQLLHQTAIDAQAIKAIGSHGHTVHHAPLAQYPFSLQIGDANIIAELTGITTVADFRRRDIAAGGQGAPLVSVYHQALFKSSTENRVIVNIGGIANITVLAKSNLRQLWGFDTGPGNTLIDYWTQKHLKTDYDNNGDWANSGKVETSLVSHFKQDSYFSAAFPKSTGKEYFSPDWLQAKLESFDKVIKPVDSQASLCQLTAETITDAIKNCAPETERVLICGGGVHNQYLVAKLEQQLNCPVQSTAAYGIDPDHVEAMAFAWLAQKTMAGQASSVSSVTGAKSARILGAIYPGGLN